MAYVYLRDAGGLLTDCVRIVEKLIFFLSLFQLIAYFCKQLKYNWYTNLIDVIWKMNAGTWANGLDDVSLRIDSQLYI